VHGFVSELEVVVGVLVVPVGPVDAEVDVVDAFAVVWAAWVVDGVLVDELEEPQPASTMAAATSAGMTGRSDLMRRETVATATNSCAKAP
jgi:hypothetical protein